MEVLRHPIIKSKVNQKGNYLFCKEQKVAEYYPEENRYDWIKYLKFNGLDKRISREVLEFDNWAREQSIAPEKLSKNFNIDQYHLYADNPNFKKIGVSISDLANNSVILDIGGSCIDSSLFLESGAKKIHQVEVSGSSQRLGLNRLKSRSRSIDRNNFYFHTCPAEYLPFKDNSFDFVFSRSTIHHTLREKGIPEISRVIKKGGQFLFFEPIVNTFTQEMVKLARFVRGVDRGSDMPLAAEDIKILNHYFSEVRMSPKFVLLNDFYDGLSWATNLISAPSVGVLYGKKK